MDIQKNESCKRLIALMFCLCTALALADDSGAFSTLKESYRMSQGMNAPDMIEKLQQAGQTCNDGLLKKRIQYRIGILFFKTQDLQRAYNCFDQIAKDTDCPPELQLAGINMAAQTARMLARDELALNHYNKLMQQAIDAAKTANQKISNTMLEKLYLASVFGKAEIYTFQGKFGPAGEIYQKAIEDLQTGIFKGGLKCLPDLYDQFSQVCLKTAKVQQYHETVSVMAKQYPDYSRFSLIQLESFAVQFLEQNEAKTDFTNGSFEAPSQLILYVKEHKDSPAIERIQSGLKKLSEIRHRESSDWLVSYHYAWLLDTIGEKETACKCLDAIITGIEDNDKLHADYLAQAILNYAKLQKALISGEQEQYKQGLECLASLDPAIKDTHVSQLADSIRNSLETLKREVPKDENPNQ
jgi:tetratricopeptide (TPR) repeat protein